MYYFSNNQKALTLIGLILLLACLLSGCSCSRQDQKPAAKQWPVKRER